GIRALLENEHRCELWFGGCWLLNASRLRDVEPSDRSKRYPCSLPRYCGGASRYDWWPHRLHLRFHFDPESSHPGQRRQGHRDLVAFTLVDPPRDPYRGGAGHQQYRHCQLVRDTPPEGSVISDRAEAP